VNSAFNHFCGRQLWRTGQLADAEIQFIDGDNRWPAADWLLHWGAARWQLQIAVLKLAISRKKWPVRYFWRDQGLGCADYECGGRPPGVVERGISEARVTTTKGVSGSLRRQSARPEVAHILWFANIPIAARIASQTPRRLNKVSACHDVRDSIAHRIEAHDCIWPGTRG
jgi:hypothetical protein